MAVFEASVRSGDHLRSGHTPEEWAASSPLFPFDPTEIVFDNGEEPEDDE